MPVVRSAEAVVHDLHGNRFTSYAAPALGTSELCVWRLEVAPETVGVEHRVSREEVMVLTAGTLHAEVDGQPAVVAAGDVLIVPAGSSLRADNHGPQPVTAWVSTSVGMHAVLPDGSLLAPPWTR